MTAHNGLVVVLFFGFVVVLFFLFESCVGLGNWVLQRLRQGIKTSCPAPKGAAGSSPAPAGLRAAWTNTSRSDAGTLNRERRQKAPVTRGRLLLPSGSRRLQKPGRAASAPSRAGLPTHPARCGRAARRDTATSFSHAGRTDPVGTGHLPRPALEGRPRRAAGGPRRAGRRPLPKPAFGRPHTNLERPAA